MIYKVIDSHSIFLHLFLHFTVFSEVAILGMTHNDRNIFKTD